MGRPRKTGRTPKQEALAERNRQSAIRWYWANRDKSLEYHRALFAAKPKKGRPKSEQHHNWKGDLAHCGAVHTWLIRNYGSPSLCDHCGRTDRKRYEWASMDHQYRRAREDFMRLCTSCHRKYDISNNLQGVGRETRKAKGEKRFQ